MSLFVVIGLFATPAAADPPGSPDVTCHDGGLTAPPTFGSAPPGKAPYQFNGVCATRDGVDLGYQASGTWTPSEANPANANLANRDCMTTCLRRNSPASPPR